MNIYRELTREFNAGRPRAIVTSGQAVVLHALAIMSKDGDWILREDDEALRHVLGVLEARGARYRYGAPLDVRWMAGGWSSHFEFAAGPLRVRTDFFTRPPRIGPEALARLWRERSGGDDPVVGLVDLAETKKTNREKDYVVIGELARRMSAVRDQLLYSRSARDILDLARAEPRLVAELAARRSVLAHVGEGRDALERELDEERRTLMHANEALLDAYARAAEGWAAAWPALSREIGALPLREAHGRLLARAAGLLPFGVEGAPGAAGA